MAQPQVTLDNQAIIVPNRALGGLTLRQHVRELTWHIDRLWVSSPSSIRVVAPFTVEYGFQETSVGAAVDVRNGKVYRLCALGGYQGRLFSSIYVGMPVKAAMQVRPDMYYDEAHGLFLFRDSEGVSIDVPVDDALPEEAIASDIYAINVFAPEAFVPRSVDGIW